MTEGVARDQSLARAEEGADRLHRTLEQLLLLARVEGSLSFDDGVQCNTEQVARLAIQAATGSAPQRLTPHLAPEVSDPPVPMPSALSIPTFRTRRATPSPHT